MGFVRKKFGFDPLGIVPWDMKAAKVSLNTSHLLALTKPQCLAACQERKLAGLNTVTAFGGQCFGQAQTGHLRLAIGATWHHLIFKGLSLFVGDSLRGNDALGRCHVRQR